MIYYFRVYGKGWIIADNKESINKLYKKYKDKGLARQPIQQRTHSVFLD